MGLKEGSHQTIRQTSLHSDSDDPIEDSTKLEHLKHLICKRHHIPWVRTPVRNIYGKMVISFFSAADRLQLMLESIERHLDLPDLLERVDGAYLADYFPLEDPRLKEACMIPFEEFVLRGDDLELNGTGVAPAVSKLFHSEEGKRMRVWEQEQKDRFLYLKNQLEES